MWATASSRASRLLVIGWAVFAAVNIALMYALPGAETIPFHFVWISFALVHGLRPWRLPYMLLTLFGITTMTFLALLNHVHAGYIDIEETAEVPLMAGIFLVMVWHVNRRQQALCQVENLAAVERRRAEAQQLFIRLGSHELRTPITVARGYTELIRAAHADLETIEDAEIVLDELAKLERITARLLTLMLVDAAPPPQLVNIDDALERMIHRWAPTVPRRWEVRSDVGHAMINADRLETALDSLLENAVKFTEAGDGISVRAWRTTDQFLIEVHDTGQGIAADDLPSIFEYFTTGPDAHGKAGTGLGLPIVRATIAARGGTVTVHSRPGVGTTFLLTIPDRLPERPITAVLEMPASALMRRRATDRPLSPA